MINSVLPGIVHTNIIPKEMVAAVFPECLTPVSAIVAAYDRFLDDSSGMSGEAVEYLVDQQILAKVPDCLNGRFSRRACTVWDPLFRMYHQELSELPDAIP
jgi:hypothetical protein